jgi:hypothetical protein
MRSSRGCIARNTELVAQLVADTRFAILAAPTEGTEREEELLPEEGAASAQ